MNIEIFQKELDILHKQYDFEDNTFLMNEILSRFDLEADNSPLLQLIQKAICIDPVKLEEMLNQYKDEMKDSASAGLEKMKDELKEKYSISGSAVVPNIDADPFWQTKVNDIKNSFQTDLEVVKAEILNQ